MLIRWTTKEDKPVWLALADHVAVMFDSPDMASDKHFQKGIDTSISKYESLIAIDRMSGDCLGIIGFSRANNNICWFAVYEEYRGKGIGNKLLDTALRQLDNFREVSVITFVMDNLDGQPARALYHKFGFVDVDEFTDVRGNRRCKMILPPSNIKRGGSFHYNYPEYINQSDKEHCPCCLNLPMPEGQMDIAELDYSYATAEYPGQGRLFGKMHVTAKMHIVDFEEMPFEEMSGFMSDIQRTAKALHKVTGAIKINYEIHANTAPHIHCHLFPRYLDDSFPSTSIDYRITEPNPYESKEEYLWFIDRMREELQLGK